MGLSRVEWDVGWEPRALVFRLSALGSATVMTFISIYFS